MPLLVKNAKGSNNNGHRLNNDGCNGHPNVYHFSIPSTQFPGFQTVPVWTNLERTRYLCVGSLASAFSLVGERGRDGDGVERHTNRLVPPSLPLVSVNL